MGRGREAGSSQRTTSSHPSPPLAHQHLSTSTRVQLHLHRIPSHSSSSVDVSCHLSLPFKSPHHRAMSMSKDSIPVVAATTGGVDVTPTRGRATEAHATSACRVELAKGLVLYGVGGVTTGIIADQVLQANSLRWRQFSTGQAKLLLLGGAPHRAALSAHYITTLYHVHAHWLSCYAVPSAVCVCACECSHCAVYELVRSV